MIFGYILIRPFLLLGRWTVNYTGRVELPSREFKASIVHLVRYA